MGVEKRKVPINGSTGNINLRVQLKGNISDVVITESPYSRLVAKISKFKTLKI